MDYKNKIAQELANYGLKPASVKLYSNKLNVLHDKLGITDFIDENMMKKILEFIENLGLDNQLAYLNSITKINKNGETNEVLIEKRKGLNQKKFENYKNNIKSKSFVNYKELLAMTNDTNFDECSIDKCLNKFLLYFSVRYPIRLSLWNLRIAKNKKDMDMNKNYILIKPKQSTIYMNDFKNVRSMGPTQILVNKTDNEVVQKYMKKIKIFDRNPEFLLNNWIHGHMVQFSSSDLYSKRLKLLLKDKLDTDISMNDIRRSYETNLIGSDEYRQMTNKQQEEEHKKLLHGKAISHLVYNKV